MLSDDFNVVGTMTDGQRAIDEAGRLKPDVVVLDVDMPGLDGFQTLHGLQQGGAAVPPVVFLSMHEADETAVEAFRRGGKGYVLKSRASRDLRTAIEQALLGRLFVPSLTSLSRIATTGAAHAMQLHTGLEPFLDSLAAFFHHALRRGDATCVFATRPVREGLNERLRARGWDTAGHPRYRVLDASDILRMILKDGMLDAGVLAATAAELDQYRAGAAEGESSRLTIFGNMVVPLSEQGNTEAMLALERTWNSLTRSLPFLTLCGYETACFHHDVPGLWSAACAEHVVLGQASDV